MQFETLKVTRQEPVCHVQIHRPAHANTINAQLVEELDTVLSDCATWASIVVLSGLPEVFCFGADFTAVGAGDDSGDGGPDRLYDIWLRLSNGPFVSIAHVRGKANAGGVGFVAACDIAIADESAVISLSELLFGLYPACVLPFLVRRVGFQKAHLLTLTTQPISARQAYEWGLIDMLEADSELGLRRLLQRMRRLGRPAIERYKRYAQRLAPDLEALKAPAVAGNLEIFADPHNLRAIRRYSEQGLFPWE